jgi:H+/Cl- antiporter ClcA
MQLDVRLPMGLLFLILGVILIVYGSLADSAMYVRHSLGQNINVTWGIIFAAFGTIMLFLARRRKKE